MTSTDPCTAYVGGEPLRTELVPDPNTRTVELCCVRASDPAGSRPVVILAFTPRTARALADRLYAAADAAEEYDDGPPTWADIAAEDYHPDRQDR